MPTLAFDSTFFIYACTSILTRISVTLIIVTKHAGPTGIAFAKETVDLIDASSAILAVDVAAIIEVNLALLSTITRFTYASRAFLGMINARSAILAVDVAAVIKFDLALISTITRVTYASRSFFCGSDGIDLYWPQ